MSYSPDKIVNQVAGPIEGKGGANEGANSVQLYGKII
jgi:hypothetical protein